LPGLVLSHDLPISASQVSGITGTTKDFLIENITATQYLFLGLTGDTTAIALHLRGCGEAPAWQGKADSPVYGAEQAGAKLPVCVASAVVPTMTACHLSLQPFLGKEVGC
jgi:hypothetical protein